MNIGNLFVRLSADTSGLQKGATTAEQSLSRVGRAGERLNRVWVGVGAALAAAFTVRKVVDFGAAAVRAAAEADVVWNRLGGTLENAGVQFSSVRGEVERAARALEDVTTIDDEGFAATLQTLVRITGDYRASLAEVSTAADVAAGAQVDLDTAAQLVGKAMIGNTATLARYGIVVEDGADAMQLLRDRFRGMAANEANTLNGKLTQLSNAWANLREAIGEALTKTVDGQSILDTFTNKIQSATRWVEDHNEVLQTWANLLGDILTKGAQVIAFLGRQSQLAKETPWWMEPFAVRSNSSFSGGPRGALSRDTLRFDLGDLGGGGSRATTPDLADLNTATDAAADAAETLANELDLAAGKTKDLKSAFETARTELEAAQFGVLARKSKDLKTAFETAIQRLRDLDLGKFTSETKAAKVGQEARTNAAPDPTIFAALETQVTGLAASFGPMAIAAAALAPVMEGLAPAFEVLREPLRILGQLIGVVITPLLERMAVPLKLVIKAYSFFVEAMGTVILKVGQLIDKIPGISGGPIIRAGQDLINGARAAREALNGTAEAAKKLTETMTFGLPQGFRTISLELARFYSSVPVPTAATSSASSLSGGVVTDNRVYTIQVYQQPGENQDTFVRKVESIIKQANQRDSLLYTGNQFAFIPSAAG